MSGDYEHFQRFHGLLLAGSTATAVLEQWCKDPHHPSKANIVAHVRASAPCQPDDEVRDRLSLGYDTPTAYRRVALMCGDVTLSEAHNWYVPERLTADMLIALATTTTPFGTVIAELTPVRETISATLLWALPPECETTPPPQNLLELRAIVYDAKGLPLAYVAETYGRSILDFGK